MENEFQPTERQTLRALERTVKDRESMTLCCLTYGSEEQHNRLASELAEKLGAHETVSLGNAREASTEGLVELLRGGKGAAPLQITDPADWPTGATKLGELITLSRGRLSDECARPLLVWGTSNEVNEILRGGMDLHSWSSGTFDFAADDREMKPITPGGDPAVPAPPARQATSTGQAKPGPAQEQSRTQAAR